MVYYSYSKFGTRKPKNILLGGYMSSISSLSGVSGQMGSLTQMTSQGTAWLNSAYNTFATGAFKACATLSAAVSQATAVATPYISFYCKKLIVAPKGLQIAAATTILVALALLAQKILSIVLGFLAKPSAEMPIPKTADATLVQRLLNRNASKA